MSLKCLTHDDYNVGWICPLEVEQTAAMAMLDERHERLPQSGDTNIYNLGSIKNHNIVIVGLPRAGNCPAAIAITQMRMTFPNLKHALLVGIGGGVPVKTDQGMIRLGHVVVSKPTKAHSGAIQYDHGKAMNGYFERNGFLNLPSTVLLNAAREAALYRKGCEHDPIWEDTQRIPANHPELLHFQYPGVKNDPLYRRDDNYHQLSGGESLSPVVVHRGTIASGEMVIKDAKKRDELARENNVLCFEMEAAGALSDFPCIVIRGISDYCDSQKNDVWHGYAAAVAAAYARQLILHMPVEETRNSPFKLPFDLSEAPEESQLIGRESELRQMQELLSGSSGRRTAVLHGLGGIGKTQLAITYAKRHRSEYSSAIWLNARDEVTLMESFARVAEKIFRQAPSITYLATAVKSQKLEDIVENVKRWLDDPKNIRWLLIYDNYDTPKQGVKNNSSGFDIRRYLPVVDQGTVIITTRSTEVKLGRSIQLGKLRNLSESLEILALSSRRENIVQDPAASNLARHLDGLPLALASAGAYLDQVSMTCAEYLQLYEKSWRQLHQETPQLPSYDHTLYSTWDISYRYIQRQSPPAAVLLRQWAYFDHQDLWFELLRDGISPNTKWFGEIASDKLTFHKTMRVLGSHGLVEADLGATQGQESRGYSIHACVHSWMRHMLNQTADIEMACGAIQCVATHVPNRYQRESWITHRRLVPHANHCLKALEYLNVGHRVASALHTLGYLYTAQGYDPQAKAVYESAIKGFERTLGPNHNSTLTTVLNLGNVLAGQDRHDQAEGLFLRILHSEVKESGRENTLELNTMSSLGSLYKAQGRFPEAETTHKRTLEKMEKIWGRDGFHTLGTVSNLGDVFLSRRQYRDAEAMYQRALEGFEKICGPEHPSTLGVVNSLGNVYTHQRQTQNAENMYQRALQGFEKMVGPENSSTIQTIHNLGIIYAEQGRFQEAEVSFRRALGAFQKCLGSEHTSTLAMTSNLGKLYEDQGRLQAAEAMYQRALDGYETTLGKDQLTKHDLPLNTLEHYGSICVKLGEVEKGLKYYQRALDGIEAAFGRGDERFVRISDKMRSAQLRRSRGRSGKKAFMGSGKDILRKLS